MNKTNASNRPKSDDQTYLSFSGSNREKTLDRYSNDKTRNYVQHSKSYGFEMGYPVDTNISIRPPFSREDYDRFRTNEALPTSFRDVVRACRAAYLKWGTIRNVIDMMTDFVIDGMRVIHPDKKTEALFRMWISKAGIRDTVSEFARHIFIDANVVIKRTSAKLTGPAEKEWRANLSIASKELEKIKKSETVNNREIPWSYSFLNVAALHWKDPEKNKMNGKKQLVFKVTKNVMDTVTSMKDTFGKTLTDKMPPLDDIVKSMDGNSITIDMDKVYVATNKKDSWDDWAPPFLYAVLSDIKFKDKLKLADLTALDGFINVIRIWKLGDHTKEILPTDNAINKLANILENSTGGGAIDIIWDSMIDMDTYYPPMKEILGAEKYIQVDKDILTGLGIPEVLIGGKGSNFSNSYIQLKTMVERIKNVREIITKWLNNEAQIFCKAMDIKIYPLFRFRPIAEDENAYRRLIVGLLDRGVISAEAVLYAYGEDFMLEVERISEQNDIFQKNDIEIKSPFDKTPPVPATSPNQKKPVQPPGRPGDTRDIDRKTRVPKVRTAELFIKGMKIIDNIEKYVLPMYIDSIDVKNARQLTAAQKQDFNSIRVGLLSAIKPEDDIGEDFIISKLEQFAVCIDNDKINLIKNLVKEASSQMNEVTYEDIKRLQASAWVEINKED